MIKILGTFKIICDNCENDISWSGWVEVPLTLESILSKYIYSEIFSSWELKDGHIFCSSNCEELYKLDRSIHGHS